MFGFQDEGSGVSGFQAFRFGGFPGLYLVVLVQEYRALRTEA